jgi:hypothetical protein
MVEGRGFVLPYKTEWQRIIDSDKIKAIQEKESLFEF